MKKLKKLAALLLAGAMVLVLFTACGGSTPEAQAEARVMNEINAGRSVPLSNDSVMVSIADKNLNTDVKIKGFQNKVHLDIVDKKVTLTVVTQYDYNNTKLQDFINCITDNNPSSDVNFNQASKWSRVGVVAKTVDGQTYVAVSVQAGKLS